MVKSVSKRVAKVSLNKTTNNKFSREACQLNMSHRRRKVGQANRVAKAVATIHKLIEEQEQSAKQMVDKTLAIGKELTRVKPLVGHGNKIGEQGWGAWLAKNFEWSEDTARRYMHLYKLVRSGKIKIRTVRNLPLAAAYVLAGHTNLPQEFFDDLTRRVDAGKRPVARQMKADIDRAKGILKLEVRTTRKTIAAPYYPQTPTKRSIAPAVPRSQLSPPPSRRRQYDPTAEAPAEPDDPALQKVLELIETACAVIDQIETPPTPAEIVAAVREQEIELTPSLARKLARFFDALGDELGRQPHSVPTDDDDEHDVPTPRGHTRH
jgi:hypothetical protein